MMDNIDKYIEELSSPEPPLLREIRRQTHLRFVQPRMVSGWQQGALLRMLTMMIRPERILEIGTFTGYSTLCFAEGLMPGARIDTIEKNDELESFEREFFNRSPFGDRINLIIGPALDAMRDLNEVYDLIFIDGDKREYPDYYRYIMGDTGNPPLVRSGSYILADNVLWYGKVAAEVTATDHYSRGIVEFNKLVSADSRLCSLILPVRDGLNLVRVM